MFLEHGEIPRRGLPGGGGDHKLVGRGGGWKEGGGEVRVVVWVFMFLAVLLAYDAPAQKLVVHRYARQNPPWNLPVLKKHWTILA